jgi:hypothetical protein
MDLLFEIIKNFLVGFAIVVLIILTMVIAILLTLHPQVALLGIILFLTYFIGRKIRNK